MNKIFKVFHHPQNTAGLIEVLHMVGVRGGIHAGNMRNQITLAVKFLHDQIFIDVQLMGNGTKMQHRIGSTVEGIRPALGSLHSAS